MSKTYNQYCALALGLDRVGGRWTLLIIRELLVGPRRFSDLRAGLPGIATNLLSERLKQLEADGIIEREELPAPAASTVYVLTEAGRSLQDVVVALIHWGARYMGDRAPRQKTAREWTIVNLRALLGSRVPKELVLRAVFRLKEGDIGFVAAAGQLDVLPLPPEAPELVIQTDTATLLGIASRRFQLAEAVASGAVAMEGDEDARDRFRQVLDVTGWMNFRRP